MKITCDCGNEMEFEPTKYEPCFKGDEPIVNDGQFVKYDKTKFSLYYYHSDEEVIECKQCKKKIWFY